VKVVSKTQKFFVSFNFEEYEMGSLLTVFLDFFDKKLAKHQGVF
jgi:hypothetical protein